MAVIESFFYVFNEKITYELLKLYDVGGSTAIHTFGAYFGLTVCFVVCRSDNTRPVEDNKPTSSYNSNIFAFIGTLFLWMYWPSFNAGYFP
jgi:ammonium transporter Rh